MLSFKVAIGYLTLLRNWVIMVQGLYAYIVLLIV